MRNRMLIPCVLILAAMIAPGKAAADSVTLTAPIRDNTMYLSDGVDANQRSNGSGAVIFSGRNNSGLLLRGLLAFDLSTIPTGATIDSVSLQLTANQVATPTAFNVSLRAVSADWGEGTSSTTNGMGVPSVAPDASWQYAKYNTVAWTSPGGDFAVGNSATTSVSTTGVYNWSGAQMTTDVQNWLTTPASNHGWLLLGDEATPQSQKRFASREDGTPATRPQLTITFTPVPVEVSGFAIE